MQGSEDDQKGLQEEASGQTPACGGGTGDFRTLRPGHARARSPRERPGRARQPHPGGRGRAPGPQCDWRRRVGDAALTARGPAPGRPRPRARARRRPRSLALARAAPPRVRASVGPERAAGRRAAAGSAGGARRRSEPAGSRSAMAPIGLKAVVGESKWSYPAAAPGFRRCPPRA